MTKRGFALTLLLVLSVLLTAYWVKSNPTVLPGATAVPAMPQEAASPASDPFAQVLQRGPKKTSTDALPAATAGHDPFKAFLEKQTVSPFGADNRAPH
jgi:hypothetical protein